MKLFWKIFFAVFIIFILIDFSISYVMVVREIADEEKNLMEENKIICDFMKKAIERDYTESKWPFESLREISEREDFLFWWIVRDDGKIHLADDASFMETYAYDYFPQITNTTVDENVFLNHKKNYGIYVKPLEMGIEKWFFFHGFSLESVSEEKKEIIFMVMTLSTLAIVILGGMLYFIIMHLTNPIKKVTKNIEDISTGKLDVEINPKLKKSKDEIGDLARAFDRTVVSLKLAMRQTAPELKKESIALRKVLEEKEKAEEALKLKDSAIKSSINAIVISNLEGNLTYVNPSFLKMWGYDNDKEVLGKSATKFWQSEEKAAEVIKSLQDKGSWIGELVAKRKDGSLFDVQLSANMVKDENGKPTYMMGSFADITQQKKAEEEIKKRTEELEKFSKLAVGRELKMVELKKEINDFREMLGKKPKYGVK